MAASAQRRITLPHRWTPRYYQRRVFEKFDAGIKRMILVYHRRAGKDVTCFNLMVRSAFERKGNYLYLFPTQRQGRKALWEMITKDGTRLIDQAAPPLIRESMRNDEMMLKLVNGSTIQISGADAFDSLVGTNYVGIVFSEYALTSPITWRYLEPILVENDGWAIFNSTPRGKNHLWHLLELNKTNPLWFCDVLDIGKTKVVTSEQVEELIRSGMPREIAEQEFYCSFTSANVGAVFARELERARNDNRITSVPHNPQYPVETWWDIGKQDATAIWFAQRLPSGRVNVIDYHEERGKGLPHFANLIKQKPYAYSRHIGPHDLDRTAWVTDQKAVVIAQNYGMHFTIAPKLDVAQGLDAARLLFPRCHFDHAKCADGLSALDAYEREWKDEGVSDGNESMRGALSDQLGPKWARHGCDAFRYGAVTPESQGIMPDWAREMMVQAPGTWARTLPPQAGFDPLGAWRG